jgi:hypothetical protein
MRILIYLLAMLSGFSAAEAARPVSSASASVDSAVAQSYVAVVAHEVDKAYDLPVHVAGVTRVALSPVAGTAAFVALAPDTPVQLHDIILG